MNLIKAFVLLILLAGCASRPLAVHCADVQAHPYDFQDAEERFKNQNEYCSPQYPLDKEKFMKAYAEGKRQHEIELMKYMCSCEQGFKAANVNSWKRFKSDELPKIKQDKAYTCESTNGKSEYQRGTELGETYAKYLEENKWNFKLLKRPDDVASTACNSKDWNPEGK